MGDERDESVLAVKVWPAGNSELSAAQSCDLQESPQAVPLNVIVGISRGKKQVKM